MTPEQQKLREAVARKLFSTFMEQHHPSNSLTYDSLCDDTQDGWLREADKVIHDRRIRAEALEEAAKVAEEEAGHCEDTGSAPSDFANEGRNDAARTIAAAIRASIPLSQEPT